MANLTPETWFFVSRFDRIEAVAVTRHTEHSVWVESRRRSRSCWRGTYYPTWSEAHAALKGQAAHRLAVAKIEIDRARSALDRAEKMKPPALHVAPKIEGERAAR